jgi:hypothetical protein
LADGHSAVHSRRHVEGPGDKNCTVGENRRTFESMITDGPN